MVLEYRHSFLLPFSRIQAQQCQSASGGRIQDLRASVTGTADTEKSSALCAKEKHLHRAVHLMILRLLTYPEVCKRSSCDLAIWIKCMVQWDGERRKTDRIGEAVGAAWEIKKI